MRSFAAHFFSFLLAIFVNNTTTGDMQKCIATKLARRIDLYQANNYIALRIKIFVYGFNGWHWCDGIQFRLNALNNMARAE